MGFVQSASASNDATATSIAVSFGSNVVGKNLIALQVCFGGSTDVVSGIADDRGTSYGSAARFQSALNVSGSVFSGLAGGSGADQVTATFSVSSQFRRIAIHEYAGWDVVDQVNSAAHDATPPANAPDSGNVTTGFDGELIFGAYHMDQGGDATITQGSGFTKREDYQHANAPAATEDKVQTSAGVTKADFTTSIDARWVCIVVTFKAAAAVGGLQLPRVMQGPRVRFKMPQRVPLPDERITAPVIPPPSHPVVILQAVNRVATT